MSLLLGVAQATAQVTTADLVGTVRDNSGAVVRNVRVTLTNVATNVARNVVTDESGNYVFTALQPGLYKLTAEADGFRRVERTGVELQINQRAQVDVELQVGAVGETVQITGSAPLLESQSSVLGSVIQEQQVPALRQGRGPGLGLGSGPPCAGPRRDSAVRFVGSGRRPWRG